MNKLTLYFPDNFPIAEMRDQSRTLDPTAQPAGYIFTVGRHPKSDVQLNHRLVSALHCQIRATLTINESGEPHYEWEIRDVNSTNGTFLRGQRLTSRNWEPLAPQDRFSLASPDMGCVVLQGFDTLQIEAEDETLDIPLEPITAVAAPAPRTPAELAWETLQWVSGGSTAIGRAYRLLAAAIVGCLCILLLALL